MNTSAQPAEGAGGSRSRAAGELTLGLMSGGERGCTRLLLLFLLFCGSWLASDGYLTADQPFVDRVHIHSCGNGNLWFRPYGESLFLQAGACQRTCRLTTVQRTIAPIASGRSGFK